MPSAPTTQRAVDRRRQFKRWVLAATLAAGMSQPSLAEQASSWAVSGFGTVGVTSQSGVNGWGFRRASSQPGAEGDVSALTDTRLGLQLNWSGSGAWEAGIQGIVLKRPPQSPVSDSIEWAYAGYRFGPDTRLRVGRTSADIFLFADSRNVGYALPWARPPVDFYGFASMSSLDGASLDHRWSTADASWRTRIAGGSFDNGLSHADGGRILMRARHVAALSLERQEDGLLLKASYLRGRLTFDTGPAVQQLSQGLAELAAIPLPGFADTIAPLRKNLLSGGQASYTALAAQYDAGPWTLVAEGSSLKLGGSQLDARRGYVSVAYRHRDISYYGVASRVRPRRGAVTVPDLVTPLTPVLGAEGALQAQALAGYATAAALRFDQGSLGVGMRWDFSPNAAFKLQADRVVVHAAGGAGWRGADNRPARGSVVSALVDFVWGQ